MVMKGQVAHWDGCQEEVGTETGMLTTGLTTVTGGTGSTTEMSPAIREGDTENRIVEMDRVWSFVIVDPILWFSSPQFSLIPHLNDKSIIIIWMINFYSQPVS